MAKMNSTGDVEIGQEEFDSIRHMLLIGLAAYGELERIRDGCEGLRLFGKDVPSVLVPLHVDASATTIGDFADALRFAEVRNG